jgi:hypothetical protein
MNCAEDVLWRQCARSIVGSELPMNQVLDTFEQMILQNMLDVVILVDLTTNSMNSRSRSRTCAFKSDISYI